MPTRATIKINDHENEPSNVLLWVQDMSDTNYSSVTQDVDELKDAIDTISLGTIQSADINKSFPEASGYPLGNPAAQREAKWLVTYQDTLQFLDVANAVPNPGYLKIFSTEIPCADLSLLPDGQEQLVLTDTVPAAFVAAFEANARSPYNHSSAKTSGWIKVLSIKHVGKNT